MLQRTLQHSGVGGDLQELWKLKPVLLLLSDKAKVGSEGLGGMRAHKDQSLKLKTSENSVMG